MSCEEGRGGKNKKERKGRNGKDEQEEERVGKERSLEERKGY